MMDRIRISEQRQVDELILLDIAATPEKRGPQFDAIERFCENLFMPVTVGGGIKSLDDIGQLLRCGADKVAINTAAIEEPAFVFRAAAKYGNQAIVISIDVKRNPHEFGMKEVVSHCGKQWTGKSAMEWATQAESLGAGEILLNAVDRDGTMEGYDFELIHEIAQAVDVPVIAAGGAGDYEHLQEAIQTGAHAVAIGAMFQFTENTPRGAAKYLHECGVPVRVSCETSPRTEVL